MCLTELEDKEWQCQLPVHILSSDTGVERRREEPAMSNGSSCKPPFGGK